MDALSFLCLKVRKQKYRKMIRLPICISRCINHIWVETAYLGVYGNKNLRVRNPQRNLPAPWAFSIFRLPSNAVSTRLWLIVKNPSSSVYSLCTVVTSPNQGLAEATFFTTELLVDTSRRKYILEPYSPRFHRTIWLPAFW
jgi:hypothetical protein